MVCYYDSQLDPSHFRLIQASVPEVLKWFSDLSASKRVEFVCGLLQLSTPPELRFYGSCLEEIARQDYESLHDSEIQANAPMENYGVLTLYNTVPLNSSISTLVTPISIPIPPSFTILNNNPTLRSKLIISLSLLNSTNIPAATSYFEMLMADESDTHSPNDPQLPTAIFKTSSLVKCKSSKSGSVSSDDSDDELSSADILRTINPQVLDEIMLIYTLAAFHPAFSFDQRQRLYKRLSIVKALSDHSLKITQLANQYKDPNKHALGGWTNPPRKSQSPSNYKHHSCLNFPARSNVPLCPASRQCRFHGNRSSINQDSNNNLSTKYSHCGYFLCHCSQCHYRGSVTRSLRRHSLPSDCLRSCGYESDENNKELIPIINPNTVDMHFNNKSDTLDVSSVTSIQTDSSSISRPDDSLESTNRRRRDAFGRFDAITTTTTTTITTTAASSNQSSNDEHYPRTARCLSCREYDSQTSNGELSIHDSDLNYLKEVHLWLKNPNRSVTTGDQFNSPNTISTKSSISLSTLSDNIHTSFSSMLLSNSQSTSKLHISDVMDSSLLTKNDTTTTNNNNNSNDNNNSRCLKQTLPASIYDNRLDLSADRQSVSELCINTTKTLTASDGTSIYKDLIRSSEEFTSCSPPINLSSINNSMYSSSSTSNGRVVATTSSSDFRFGAEKCLKTISDFCPLFPKRHSSGSSPISTPPSEESSSDSTALKASSPEYWTPKGASRYVRGMYTPYQSHGQTFRPVVNDSRESQIKNTSSSNRSSQTSHSMVVSQSSSISKRKSYNQFTLEDFPSLSTLRSMVNAESSNVSTKHNKTNNEKFNSFNNINHSCNNSNDNNNTCTRQLSITCATIPASSCESSSSVQNSQLNFDKLPVVSNYMKHGDNDNTVVKSIPCNSTDNNQLEPTFFSSNSSNFLPIMITNSTTCSHISVLSRAITSTTTTTISVCTTCTDTTNSNNFAISPHYWTLPEGPIPILPSALYSPYLLPTSTILENFQSMQRLPMLYQWTVQPADTSNNSISCINNVCASFIPYLSPCVGIFTTNSVNSNNNNNNSDDDTQCAKMNIPESNTIYHSSQESDNDEHDKDDDHKQSDIEKKEKKMKGLESPLHSTSITDAFININNNNNNIEVTTNITPPETTSSSICNSQLELLQKDLFPQSYILLPSYPPTPIPATTTNILPYSTSNIYVNTLNSCGIVQNSPVCQASTTITTTICNNNSGGGGIDLITNSNNLPTNHQLNTTMMKQLNDERNLPDNKKIKVSNDTNICPISHEKTFNSINATGNSTTSPSFVTTDTTILTTNLNINRIHSSNRLIPHQSYGSNRIDIINTEETHKNPPVNTAENCDCSDSTNSNKPYPLWSTSETVCNPTWLYPRFPARPDSSNGLTSSTSGSQRTYPTRGYSPMNFNNSVLPRGYNQPPIASSFYYTQHPGLPLVPNSVSSHSQFIGSVPNPNVHFQQPHPLYGLVPSASSTSGASLNGYPGIPIASNSFKPNISSVGQSSVASVDPMPTAALLQNALIQIPNVPLLQNFVLHPPLHPTYPPLIPNLPANCPNNPAMTISSWSSINGPRIVSCYNCGQPGHKANVCPSRWSSQQLSESVFSLNYAPRK
uniref:CCHC-type domain-containing protein n=1 Tax=Schistosoma mansoni TaxID=6183 RepID=A0A5K4FEX9_SCHMA